MTSWQLSETFASIQGTIRWTALGAGDPVVLLHGTPFSSYVWRDVAEALASQFRIYVWDMAGYGTSDKFEGQDVSLAEQARVFAAFLDHLGLDAPAVVGHDFGGTVALRTLLIERRAYRRLVLVDPVALRPWGTGFYQLAKEHSDVLRRLPAPVHDGLVRGYVTWAAHRPVPNEVADRLVAPWTDEEGRAALYRQIIANDQQATDDIQDRYGEINVATKIIWGEHDAWLPLTQAHELQRAIPGAQLVVLPDAGHLVQHDQPRALTDAIADFLAT